jgi:hypothetical protein
MSDIHAALERLVRRDVLRRDQAEAVLEEIGQAPTAPGRQEAPKLRPVAEITGYLGGTLAAVSAFVVAAEYWDQLLPWARSALLALATTALVAGGWWVVDNETPAVRRLVSVLWLLAAGTGAWAVGTLTDAVAGLQPETSALLVGLALLLGGSVLRWRHPRALQQLPVLAGAALAGGGALWHLPNPPDDLGGVLLWALGVAWAALSWAEMVRPVRTGLAVGSVTALAGAQVLAWNTDGAGIALGLGSTVAGFAIAALIAQPILAALSVAGMVVFLPQAVFAWFEATLAVPLALFATGVVLLAGSLATVKLSTNRTDV